MKRITVFLLALILACSGTACENMQNSGAGAQSSQAEGSQAESEETDSSGEESSAQGSSKDESEKETSGKEESSEREESEKEESKKEESKKEESKKEESKKEESKKEESKKEESKKEESKKEESKKEESKKEESQKEESKKEESKAEESSKQEESKEESTSAVVPTKHTPVSASQYYQYKSLSATDKQFYSLMLGAMQKMENRLDVAAYSFSPGSVQKVMDAVLADHPELFYVIRSCSYSYNSANVLQTVYLTYTDGTTPDVFAGDQLIQTADRNKINQQIQELNNKVKAIVATISPALSAVEKEKQIHDYIVDHMIYDYQSASASFAPDRLPHAYDLYGAVCQGVAVCEGYTKMMQYLCYQVGINATQVVGNAGGGGHMWNAVQLDDGWYHVDVTWDDSNENYDYYGYFNLTTKEINNDHTITDPNLAVPSCSSNTYQFYRYFAMEMTSASQAPGNYEKALDLAVKNGDAYLLLYVGSQGMSGDYVQKYFIAESSPVVQYMKQKGYDFTVERGYARIEGYVYLKIID